MHKPHKTIADPRPRASSHPPAAYIPSAFFHPAALLQKSNNQRESIAHQPHIHIYVTERGLAVVGGFGGHVRQRCRDDERGGRVRRRGGASLQHHPHRAPHTLPSDLVPAGHTARRRLSLAPGKGGRGESTSSLYMYTCVCG